MKYNPQKIEKKWQAAWEKKKLYHAKDSVSGKKNFYHLVMFPYPSGNLHIGHWYNFAPADVYARMMRRQGFNVLSPIGFDAFGLPAENAALKRGIHPEKWTMQNIKTMTKQLRSMGNSYDWTREVITCLPEYYQWNQWIFLQLFKKGLAYRTKAPANWCPKDKTVLANEQVVEGKCDRCGAEVEQREIDQWLFKITKYAEPLLQDLEKFDWPESTKVRQRNWIGKSEGAEIEFPILLDKKTNFLILHGYTGLPNKNFIPWLKKQLEGQGYRVQAPEMPNTKNPKEEEQINYVLENCKINENTVLIGHSLGGVVAMKILSRHNKFIKGLVLIASAVDPLFPDDIDREERPFWKNFKWDFKYDQIKKLASFRIVLSDLQEKRRIAYLEFLSEKLNAKLITGIAKREHFCAVEEPIILENLLPMIKVFTTRPDTLFGATYAVLAPEHLLVKKLESRIENVKEVNQYIETTKHKSDLERQENKEKTGVELKGVKAVNPANGEALPIFVADYVLGNVGTGAIMAVPAHDERDFAFAKKYNLPVKRVIAPHFYDHTNPPHVEKKTVERIVVQGIVKHWNEDKVLQIQWKKLPWKTFVIGGAEVGEDIEEAVRREVREETGYQNFKLIRKIGGEMRSEWFADHKDENRYAHMHAFLVELADGEQKPLSDEESAKHTLTWVPFEKIPTAYGPVGELDYIWRNLNEREHAYVGEGVVINSGEFSEMKSEDAREKMGQKFGIARVQYKLRDWLISRQRYWGTPIPIIYCKKCGMVPVPEKDLPVKLPSLKDFKPVDNGRSPLARNKKFLYAKCPQCGSDAERETDTMDTFVDSSWYFIRYTDPKNKKLFADAKKIKAWLPVNMYVGGAEHTVLHLLYSRFFTKFLHDEGCLDFAEPFFALRHQGIILGPDGHKMSKSRGNVVDPDVLVQQYGADCVRMHLCFMGPYDQGGPWNPGGINGMFRFLNRVWNVSLEMVQKNASFVKDTKDDLYLLHASIKKVTDDIRLFHFNTAISQLMVLLNRIEENKSREMFLVFLCLLAPFAPHLAEEIWFSWTEKKESVHELLWPEADPRYLVAETFELVVQVNGKVRLTITLPVGASQQDAEDAVKQNPAVQKYLEGKTHKKIIFVPNRLINFVI